MYDECAKECSPVAYPRKVTKEQEAELSENTKALKSRIYL
jgi:hypothetical protein